MGTVDTCWGTGWCSGGECAGGGAYEPRCMSRISSAAVLASGLDNRKAGAQWFRVI